MRYTYSQRNFRSLEPKKKRWPFGGKTKRRVVVEKSEAAFGVRYGTPYRASSRRTIKLPGKPLMLGMLVSVWVGLLLYLPYFRINTFSYNGLRVIKESEIDTVVQEALHSNLSWLPLNNYFAVSADRLEKRIQDRLPLESVEVVKVFPHSIEISVQEKISSIVYDTGRGYFILDQNGTAIKKLADVQPAPTVMLETAPASTTTSTPLVAGIKLASTTTTPETASTTPSVTPETEHVPQYQKIRVTYGSFPVVYDRRAADVVENQERVLPREVIEGIIRFYNTFNKSKIATINYMEINDAVAGVTASTDRNWKILFDPRGESVPQVENIQVVLEKNKPKDYIDVRFGGRVYWK